MKTFETVTKLVVVACLVLVALIPPARGRRLPKPVVAGTLAIALVVLLAGCGSTAGSEDAPVGPRHEAPRHVWVMSDGYSNVEAVCVGVNGVYVQQSDPAAVAVVPYDGNCEHDGILHDHTQPEHEAAG